MMEACEGFTLTLACEAALGSAYAHPYMQGWARLGQTYHLCHAKVNSQGHGGQSNILVHPKAIHEEVCDSRGA
jgi:hypothetical protein